jgi:hypothetical protein
MRKWERGLRLAQSAERRTQGAERRAQSKKGKGCEVCGMRKWERGLRPAQSAELWAALSLFVKKCK